MATVCHFLYRLIAPRPTFHMDMDDREKNAMQQHMNYWVELTQKRTSIVYGPVFDPQGVWGMAVIEVASIEDSPLVAKGDPAVSSGVCTYELVPMQVGLLREANSISA